MAATRRGPEPLGDGEQVVVQVPAAINQWHLIGQPDSQLDCDPAGSGCHHRTGQGINMGEEISQPHLAWGSCLIPAG